MDTLDAILTRRSIRKYTSEPVQEETIMILLEAAMSAPSAGNEQPWHFIVIRDRKILSEIVLVHPHAQMLNSAPLAILVCCDEKMTKYPWYWIQDCSAATQNILLSIQAKGLGGVWVGVYPHEKRVTALRNIFGLPDHVIPFSLIPLGHPAEMKPPANRFSRSRIHFDQWMPGVSKNLVYHPPFFKIKRQIRRLLMKIPFLP